MTEVYRIDKNTIDNIKWLRTNYVLVKIDDPNEYRRTKGGIYLYIDTIVDRMEFANRHGIVVKICNKLRFNQDEGDINSIEYDTDIEIKEGDRVWFVYLDGLNCVEFDVQEPYEDGFRFVKYKMLRYDSLRVKKDESEIRTLNGYVLTEPFMETIKSTLFLNKKQNLYKGIVAYTGTSNRRYKTPSLHDDPSIKAGDTILINHPYINMLEDKVHKYFDKEYRIVKGSDIICKLN